MTTIILTLIGILLAAAAALMIVYYGGDAFGVGNVAAEASTLANAGTNVLMAAQLHEIDFPQGPTGTDSNAIRDEFLGEYLDQDPAIPSALSAQYTQTSYRIIGVSDEVCDRVNEDRQISPSAIEDGKMGCFDGTFFATF